MKVPRILRSVVLLRLALLAGLLFATARLVAPVTFPFSSGDLVVRVSPSVPGGAVLLDLGPFGELSWRTHNTPINVRASFIVGQSPRELPNLADIRDLRVGFLVRKLPWLALGGALGALLIVPVGSIRKRALAAGIGAVG